MHRQSGGSGPGRAIRRRTSPRHIDGSSGVQRTFIAVSLLRARARSCRKFPVLRCSRRHGRSVSFTVRIVKRKSEPDAKFRFNPDSSTESFDDLLTDGKAHPCAGVAISVQTFEDPEDLPRVLRINTNSVV